MSDANGRPAVGLVLGGGGTRGLAHVGVLCVLQREGIAVDCIAGTSMGGLVGALYAAGVPMDAVHEEVRRFSSLSEKLRLIDIRISSAGLSIRGRRIYNYMADLLGADLTFADLRLPLALVATDIRAGREVVLRDGPVIDAVRASISIPGIFEPVDMDDYRLVDGGVLNNVPVDVIREMGATRTIAVDVLPTFSRNVPGLEPVEEGLTLPFAPLFLNETYHVLMIMIAALTDGRLREYPPDLLIRPDLPADVTLLSGFNQADDVIAAGAAAAEEALPAIRDLLDSAPTGRRGVSIAPNVVAGPT